MPFLYMDINVRGFSRKRFAEILEEVKRIHISEISFLEAKVKTLQLWNKEVTEKFNAGLLIMRSDEKILIHGYNQMHDRNLNELSHLLNYMNIIDLIISVQAKEAGVLLTENRIIHKHSSELGIKVLNWKSYCSLFEW